jgi:F-type H+-transporting ATPase subunit a
MGEHTTWTDYFYYLPGYKNLYESLQHMLAREPGGPLDSLIGPSHFSLTHVWWALFVLAVILIGGLTLSSALRGGKGLVPPPRFNLRNFFELIADTIYGLMRQVMGDKPARYFLPLIGSLALFIWLSNLCALIPGFGVPTTSLNTNIGMALTVFLVTHIYGVKEHGPGYLRHFLGPIWWLAPLMFVIEVIGHIARPVSLSLRLLGNMAADHKVVFAFFTLVPLLIPVPFLILGLLVTIVQTVVFCLLSMVYISMAISHDH